MSEWREIWANGLPSAGRSPRSGHRMAAEGMQFPRRWYGGMISANLEGIWVMSDQSFIDAMPTITAGDFNNHVRWDKPGYANNHADTVARFNRYLASWRNIFSV